MSQMSEVQRFRGSEGQRVMGSWGYRDRIGEPIRDQLTDRLKMWNGKGRTGTGGILAVQLHLDIAVIGVQRQTHARIAARDDRSSLAKLQPCEDSSDLGNQLL